MKKPRSVIGVFLFSRMAKKESAFAHGYMQYKRRGAEIAESNDRVALKAMIDRLFSEQQAEQQRAAAVCHSVADHAPALFAPHVETMLAAAKKQSHPSVIRTVFRTFSSIDIFEKHLGEVIDLAFQLLTDHNEPVAVKVYAMTVIANHLERYPDLAIELETVLREGWKTGSPGYRNRALKIGRKYKLSLP
jgi:hypothetical protein